MPAYVSGTVRGETFHVVGEYGAPGIVSHVGLMHPGVTVELPNTTGAVHCEPPLRVGVEPGGEAASVSQMRTDIVAWMDLTTEERHAMETWLSLVKTSLSAMPPASDGRRTYREYVVYPHTDVFRDKRDESIRFRRYSCVGFVFECYWDGAAIRLVDAENVPSLQLDAISEMFVFTRQELVRSAPHFGLTGAGPWRVLLPGYVVHSLARTNPRNEAFLPNYEDAWYPRR